jgi:hypothetical protein
VSGSNLRGKNATYQIFLLCIENDQLTIRSTEFFNPRKLYSLAHYKDEEIILNTKIKRVWKYWQERKIHHGKMFFFQFFRTQIKGY